jgi:Cu+-exporting ATPase
MARDPVCRMEVNPNLAAARRGHRGRTYYFCCVACATKFDRAPERYVKPEPPGKAQASSSES